MAGCVVAVHHNHLKHTYDSSEFGVWSSYTVREAYKPLNLRKATKETIRSKAMKTPKTTNVKISKTSKLNTVSCLTYSAVKSRKRATYSRDPKGDGVYPSVALRLSNCLQSWMLRSYVRASPSGAQAHRIHICYCINCTVCTIQYCIYCIYCILT